MIDNSRRVKMFINKKFKGLLARRGRNFAAKFPLRARPNGAVAIASRNQRIRTKKGG